MSHPKLIIPFGTTEPLDLQLTDDGENLVGTGLTLGIEIQKYVNGAYEDVDTPPTVAWLSAASGTVRVTDADVLEEGSYYVRFSLDNGAGDVGYVPNGKAADLWVVVPIANKG
jgi:hypothetical protein